MKIQPVTKPKVSVITASLNSSKTLLRCLDSVKGQRGISLEHIIIDGNSSDGTVDILKSRDGGGLLWLSEPDTGIAEAMNKGISLSSGDWLYFLQADDKLASPDSLHRLLGNKYKETGILSGNVCIHHDGGKPRLFESRGWTLKMAFKTTIPHQGALIRSSLFSSIGLYDESLSVAMDYDWFLRAYWAKIPLSRSLLTVAEMSGSGISSRRDWQSLSFRFNEERKIHFNRAPSPLWGKLYRLYWFAYWPYRKARFIFRF